MNFDKLLRHVDQEEKSKADVLSVSYLCMGIMLSQCLKND